MYTLNITVKVDHDIDREWLLWQQNVQIPNTLESKCFSGFHFHRLLGHDEEDGVTYVIQYVAPSKEKYDEFITCFDETLRNTAFAKWGSKVYEFRTVLEKV